MTGREDIRNVAIVAYVDHGKTTLVDAIARADLDARFSPDAIAAGFDAVYRRAMEAA